MQWADGQTATSPLVSDGSCRPRAALVLRAPFIVIDRYMDNADAARLAIVLNDPNIVEGWLLARASPNLSRYVRHRPEAQTGDGAHTASCAGRLNGLFVVKSTRVSDGPKEFHGLAPVA